jgi:hypothetical protein
MATIQQRPIGAGREHGHRQLSAIGWGLLFIWVGVAILAQVGWGYGVGVIILASQVAHLAIGGARFDVFSTVVGLIFLLGGIWVLFGIQVGLVPVLCIAAGVALMLSALTSRPVR